jgi:hypothetical protein
MALEFIILYSGFLEPRAHFVNSNYFLRLRGLLLISSKVLSSASFHFKNAYSKVLTSFEFSYYPSP